MNEKSDQIILGYGSNNDPITVGTVRKDGLAAFQQIVTFTPEGHETRKVMESALYENLIASDRRAIGLPAKH